MQLALSCSAFQLFLKFCRRPNRHKTADLQIIFLHVVSRSSSQASIGHAHVCHHSSQGRTKKFLVFPLRTEYLSSEPVVFPVLRGQMVQNWARCGSSSAPRSLLSHLSSREVVSERKGNLKAGDSPRSPVGLSPSRSRSA